VCRVRVLVALGGNAMTGPDGRAGPEDQIAAAEVAMEAVADLVASGVDVAITHGNGPQVGNILVKNELSAAVVPPVPLDWCVAQTQATLGFVLMNALQPALARRGVDRPVAALVTRTLVDRDDPGFDNPTKPIGRYLPREEAELLVEHGQRFEDRGERGWRRVVASPDPRQILDAGAVAALVDQGYVVVANGGGGTPVVRESDGSLRGVEAVIDKDLGAALLADAIQADRLVIATDVEHAILDFGTDRAQPIETVDLATMRTYAAAGQFASGSMGPKVDAICRYVQRAGQPGVITSLANLGPGVRGQTGTIVVPDGKPSAAAAPS
jgi:carbamate kinase